MRTDNITIGEIPAVLWGEPQCGVFVAVHGSQGSKRDSAIEILARVAAEKSVAVLSFDLPEHGERVGRREQCEPKTCVRDIRAVLEHAKTLSKSVSLFGCSLGAYFGLMACRDDALEQCVFLSPVLELRALIEGMMQAAGVSAQRLEHERAIATPFQMLYWDYYQTVVQNPITRVPGPVLILYGETDALTPRETAERFAREFGCGLTVLAGGEHYFHTEQQLAFYEDWLRSVI